MSDDPHLSEKLYFVGRWQTARLYAELFRTMPLTRNDFTAYVNKELGLDYDVDTLMMMIDVYNVYAPLGQGKQIPNKVREIGMPKARKAIPWVMQYPDKVDAIFAICRENTEKSVTAKLRAAFPFRK